MNPLEWPWFLILIRPFLKIGYYLDQWLQHIDFILRRKRTMYRIVVVGDLSMNDPTKLDKAMVSALSEKCDILVHVGDIHDGYDVVKKYAQSNHILAVPGNHDTEWDQRLGWRRQWYYQGPNVHMIGLDNSKDKFCQADWDVVNSLPNDALPVLVFLHKPLTRIVFPDGSESGHIMSEGGLTPTADSLRLQDLLRHREVVYVHGHYHGWTYMKTNYGDCLIEGRGGAAPQIGYTIIVIQPEGIVLHPVTL